MYVVNSLGRKFTLEKFLRALEIGIMLKFWLSTWPPASFMEPPVTLEAAPEAQVLAYAVEFTARSEAYVLSITGGCPADWSACKTLRQLWGSRSTYGRSLRLNLIQQAAPSGLHRDYLSARSTWVG
jgi:hypothetical protein